MAKRKNILFITTDYQAWEDNPVDSPFLDMPAMQRIADEGAICQNHYSTAPICMPARYTWVTGQYPHTHGQFDNRPQWVPESSPILMEHLKAAGYYTLGVGKMHFYPIDRMAGFDRRIIADQKEGRGINDDYAKFIRSKGYEGNRIRLKNDQLKEGDFYHCYDFPEAEEMHIDHYVGTQARQLIEQDELGDDPWFMWVSFNGPHSPWDPPSKYSKPYLEMDLPAPRFVSGELDTKSANSTQSRYIYTRDAMEYIDEHPEQRDTLFHSMRARHYGNLTMIDRQVEQVLNALEARGKLEETIVIWTADHGSYLGDHDLIHKSTAMERSAHVPFFVRYPESVPVCSRVAGFTAHVDLFPTLMQIADAPTPQVCEGKNVWPVITGQTPSVQDEAFVEIRNDVTIVNDDWKFTVVIGDWQATDRPIRTGELFDRKNDPDEMVNLYDHPEYADVQAELTQRLVEFSPRLAPLIAPSPTVAPLPQPERYTFAQGEVCNRNSRRQPPHEPGREMTVELTLGSVTTSDTGVLIVSGSFQHGYTVRLDGGKLCFGAQRWQRPPVVLETTLGDSDAPVMIGARWSLDGTIAMSVNGEPVAQGHAGGPMPIIPGREIRSTAGQFCVGCATGAGPDRIPLLSADSEADTFTGVITSAILRLEE